MWDYYKTERDKETDLNYTKNEINEAMNNPVQLHYATGIKPWKNVDCTKSEIWFKYIVKTPFLEDYLKQLPKNIIIPESRSKVVIRRVGIKETIKEILKRLIRK